jgi:hypothetical protein
MKPFLGATVIVAGIPSNGSSAHPALVNRVWGKGDTAEEPVCINVTVFPDCAEPTCRTSVLLFQTAEQARAHIEQHAGGVAAYWPEGA